MSSDEKKCDEKKDETFAFADLFGESLLNGTKTVKTADHLKGKTHVMIYFSAHWCPPCRGFTPSFAKWYKTFMKTEKGKKTEVVFKSWDRDESSYNSYFKTMPWTAIPYTAEEDPLGPKFGVNGIPMIVVLDSKGEVVTKKGRAGVMSDSEGANFPWPQEPTEEVTGEINGTASLVVIYKDADDLKKNKVGYNEIAKGFKKGKKDLLFFHLVKGGGMHSQLMTLFKLDDDVQMAICDIPNKQRFLYKAKKDNSGGSIKAFVEAYMDGDSDALDQKGKLFG